MNMVTCVNVSGMKKKTRAMLARPKANAYSAGRSPHGPAERSLLANQAPAIGPTMNPIENAKPTKA